MANTSSSQPERATNETSTTNTLISEITSLQEFVSSPLSAEDEAGENLAALLKQLEAANGVAQGVETKLDKLLGNLEEMLEGLEGAQGIPPEGPHENGPLSEPPNQDTHEKETR